MKYEITIIGGDGRFTSVRDYFIGKGFTVNTAFFGDEPNGSICDTVILPVPVFRNGFLNAPLTKEKADKDSVFNLLNENSTVFGGMIPDGFISKCEKKNIRTVDYFRDESLLKKNAVLTAKAVPFILNENSIPVKNGKIIILGYGRCGSAIAGVLSSAGGHVTVVSSKSKTDGFDRVCFERLTDILGEARLIINTVPSTVLSSGALEKINRDAVIIEIASAPYGIDFESAERLDLKVIKAPSLPGRYFPVEAGIAVSQTIFKELK